MVPQQDAPLAEQQFKNIKSLKGSKASDVIPAMHFISASLGVGCDYCHAEDRASDEKRAKGTAREMIAMQRDINAKNFGGRNQVTCATCHGGHTHPLGTPPVVGLDVRARRSQDVKAEDVIAAYGKAIGGDATHSITGVRLEGTSETGGVKSKLEATYSGSKFYVATHDGKTDQQIGFNGTSAWFALPGGPRTIPLMYVEQNVNEKALFMGPDTLPKLMTPAGGTAKLFGRDNLVVSGTIVGESTRASLFFDKETGLLSRSEFFYPSVLGTITQINDFADYRKVNGYQVPMKITNHAPEGETVVTVRKCTGQRRFRKASFRCPKVVTTDRTSAQGEVAGFHAPRFVRRP